MSSCVNQLADQDQELYKDFNMVVSERWQQEVAETVFEAINADTDRKRRCTTDEDSHSGKEISPYDQCGMTDKREQPYANHLVSQRLNFLSKNFLVYIMYL